MRSLKMRNGGMKVARKICLFQNKSHNAVIVRFIAYAAAQQTNWRIKKER